MNMKNFIKPASVAALLITSLLVITGCQGIFDPPATEPGTGTLIVSFGGDGRTILPAARLDKYVLDISQSGTTITDGLRVLTSGTGLVLTAGSYDLKVYGFVLTEDADADAAVTDPDDPPEGWILVAEGSTSATVTAGEVSSAAIALTPADTGTDFNDGKGYFDWDFEELSITELSVKIYDVEDDTTLIGTEITDLTGDVELDAGVYAVLIEVTAGGETYKWVEVLYIYAGLTSKYVAALSTNESAPTIPYVVPESGYGYFYVDLNDWKTQTPASAGINANVPAATTSATGITAYYTENNQRVNFGFTSAQIDILKWVGKVDVTIVGSTVTGTNNFRYHIGDATTGQDWNVSNGSGDAAFSALASAAGITKDQTIDQGRLDKIKHFIVQLRAAGTNTITINSIKISYDPETAFDGGFDLDLSGAKNATSGVTAWNVVDSAVNPTFASGVLTATFTAQYQRVNIPLEAAQEEILVGDAGTTPETPSAEVVFVTIWGSATPDYKLRYHMGNPDTANNWNSTGGAGDTEISNLASATGITRVLGVSNPERGFAALILNYYDSNVPSTFEISRIRVDYKLKEVYVPPPAATADLAIITTSTPAAATDTTLTLTQSFAATYQNIEIALDGSTRGNSTANVTTHDGSNKITIALPDGLKLGSYGSFTLKLAAYTYELQFEVDGDGDPVLDGDGNPVPVYEVDDDGNQVMDDDGNPIQVVLETPVAGELIQFAFVSDTSNFWNNRLGGNFIHTTPAGGFTKEPFTEQAEQRAETIAGIYMQNKVAFDKLVITEFTLHKPD